jgi:hypothetical protein
VHCGLPLLQLKLGFGFPDAVLLVQSAKQLLAIAEDNEKTLEPSTACFLVYECTPSHGSLRVLNRWR